MTLLENIQRYKDIAKDVLPLSMFEKSEFRELESFFFFSKLNLFFSWSLLKIINENL